MAKKSYSEEQKLEAWEKAAKLPGKDPAKIRADNVNNTGAIIHWDRFESDEPCAWTIDQHDRAREKTYKRRDMLHKAAQHIQAEEDANQQREIESYEKAANEAGIPGAWKLFERIAMLEATVRKLQQR